MADKVLVREMGTKFIVGFCGANLRVVLLEPRAEGNVLEAKIGFVALVSSAQHHLRPIKLSNYRKQLFSCFLGSEEIHPVKVWFLNASPPSSPAPPKKEKKEQKNPKIQNINTVSGEPVCLEQITFQVQKSEGCGWCILVLLTTDTWSVIISHNNVISPLGRRSLPFKMWGSN